MRTFSNPIEMLSETTRELFSRGIVTFDRTMQGIEVDRADYESKELIGYALTLTHCNPPELDAMLEWARKSFHKPHLNPSYAKAWFESMWIGSEEGEVQAHLKYNPEYWKKFAANGFSYTYPGRMHASMKSAIEALKKNRHKRGAVIEVYHPEDIRVSGKRVPCSVFYQPLIRTEGCHDHLNLIYVLRSCDLTNFFPMDVYRAHLLKSRMAWELNCLPGDLILFISSLHAYRIDVPEQFKW
jgi:thymidylate synthase